MFDIKLSIGIDDKMLEVGNLILSLFDKHDVQPYDAIRIMAELTDNIIVHMRDRGLIKPCVFNKLKEK